MEATDCEAFCFASDVEDAKFPSEPSFLNDGSSSDDEIFDRTVVALLALSTKRPYYSTSSHCDSLASFQQKSADLLVTPSSQISRRIVASATLQDFGAAGQQAEDTTKSKKAPSKLKKVRSASGKKIRSYQNSSKKAAASLESKKAPNHSTKKRTPPSKARSPAASSSKSFYDSRWDSMVRKLKAYHKKHGHCRVPRVYEADQVLSNWVHNQRYSKALTQERIDILNDLDFAWTAIDTPQVSIKKKAKTGKDAGTIIRETSSPRPLGNHDANRRVDRATSSVSKAVHSRRQVERKRKEPPTPSITPSTSRKAPKTGAVKFPPPSSRGQEKIVQKASKKGTKGSLSKGSIDDSEARLAVYDGMWTKKFNALRAYFAVHGDTFVPATYPSNQPLSNWIRNQRSAFRRGDLLQDRIDRLDKLSADWAKPHADKAPIAELMGAPYEDKSSSPEEPCPDKSPVLSAVDLTVPEAYEVVTGSQVAYTGNVTDESKQVIASIVWSPPSNKH